jgi:beta-galactosidase
VELFLNGKSLGTRKKRGDSLHVVWRVPFEPGTLMAISRKNGKIILTKEIMTAGKPAKIQLIADRKILNATGEDLSFITVRILDANNNLVPYADNLVEFSIQGEGTIVSVDNGNPVSMESFKASERKAFNGMCLAIIKGTQKNGSVNLSAKAAGLIGAEINIKVAGSLNSKKQIPNNK